jgi:intergrase/recombinase
MNKLTKLLNLIIAVSTKHHVPMVIAKSGVGINCYETALLTPHIESIEKACAQCDWKVTYFEAEYTKGQKTKNDLYYIGPQSTKSASADDILALNNAG